MWREDNIIEEIVEDSNIEDAIKTVLRKRRRKRSFAGRRILADVPKAVERIRQRIRSGRFKLGGYREMTVDDGPKVRTVQSVSLEDRIVLNAVMNVVDRHLKVRFIRTTSASIKNRGTHDLLQYIVKDIKDDPEGTLFGYQFDITKFYESVDQDILLDAVKKMFKDKILIGILEECIRMMPKGVSIGLRSSQGLCNLLLSIYLDHRLKDQEAVAHYYRYCDDGLVLSGSKKYLWKVRDIIHEQARKARLEIKSNDTVFPITEGIDFLGYVTRPDHVRLRKRNKQKFARKMQETQAGADRLILRAYKTCRLQELIL
ncbi:reverse transcriptase domain-containing protein [Bacteroides caccae]|nr:reverse transcriptase domain-containing protein [Bacteroides caccae]